MSQAVDIIAAREQLESALDSSELFLRVVAVQDQVNAYAGAGDTTALALNLRYLRAILVDAAERLRLTIVAEDDLGTPEDLAPVAFLTPLGTVGDPALTAEDLVIRLDASASYDQNTGETDGITLVEWAIVSQPVGETATLQAITPADDYQRDYTPTLAGTHRIRVTVTNARGLTHSVDTYLSVSGTSPPPTPHMSPDKNFDVGTTLRIYAATSEPAPGRTITNQTVAFVSTPGGTPALNTVDGFTTPYPDRWDLSAATVAGAHVVRLTVTQSDAQTATLDHTFTAVASGAVSLDETLGVFRGGTTGGVGAYDTYASWLGKSPVSWNPNAPWKGLGWSGWKSAINTHLNNYLSAGWVARGVRFHLAVGLCPQDHGGTGTSPVRSGEAGEFDSHWTWLGDRLEQFADSLDALGLDISDRLILRPGWEHNGSWYPWTSNPVAKTAYWGSVPADSGRPAAFAAYYKRLYDLVMGRLSEAHRSVRWALNYARSGGSVTNANAAFPTGNSSVSGRRYVDILSLDLYDSSNYYIANGQNAASWAAVWEAMESGTGAAADSTLHLDWLEEKADLWTAGQLGIDEWGMLRKASGSQTGGLDNQSFITNMHTWLVAQAAAGRLVYHSYFDMDATDGHHKLSPSPTPLYAFTLAKAEYLSLFGA